MNQQWSVLKEAKNTIGIINKMKSDDQNQTKSKQRALEKLESCEIGVMDESNSESSYEDDKELEFNMLRFHAQKIESDINKCLMTRIKDEPEFGVLKELEEEIMKLSEQEFVEKFDKETLQQKIQEQQSQEFISIQNVEEQKSQATDKPSNYDIDSYIEQFWLNLDQKFQMKFVDKPLCEIIFELPNAR